MVLEKKKLIKYVLLAALGAVIGTILNNRNKESLTARDWNEIIENQELRILTTYNTIDYILKDDSVQGFQYELLHAILDHKGFSLKITPTVDLSQQIEDLKSGKYDLLASNLIVTSELKEQIALTYPILKNKQVLVQRKDSIALSDSLFIDNQINLAKKTLYVIKDSPAILRINNLSNEIADTIYIEELEKYGEEQLIALVAHGDINYAVCDEQIALNALDSLPQIDASLAIGFTQFYSWGVNKESPILLDSLNIWIDKFIQTKEYQKIYSKYYR
ncbi:extracellular solute-binding protein family 3 [Bacteroides coprosuis DSM 18011]|uniref:Extracellular solute-binding protein family 3 n=3 Tax=Bacteroides TaxID=816 RepID=F3ZTW9_9BACE|nr:extracellular solute-binding protein family 3 [Bacteroides coprosuis DSM 18011]